jgi:hypothetical protein
LEDVEGDAGIILSWRLGFEWDWLRMMSDGGLCSVQCSSSGSTIDSGCKLMKSACTVSHLAFFEVYIRPDGAMMQILQGPCVVTQRCFRQSL